MLLPKAHASPRASVLPTWRIVAQVWLVTLIVGAGLLALINLPYAPATWFDEGSHLHVPKTLLQHGVYADISSEGFRYYGPTVGIGPTVMLPLALAMKLFGIGLVQGRLVIVAYLALAIVGTFLVARKLHGLLVALLATTLFLASRTIAFPGAIEYGRQVLGEIPGVAFLLLGTWAWLLALRRTGRAQRGLAVLAGFGFGLALVTKNQFVLIVPPTLALLALLDWRYYRATNWPMRIIPLVIACGCFGLWTLAQFQFLGPGSFVENMQQTRQAAGGAIFVFNARAVLRSAAYVLRPDLYGACLVPALAYACYRAWRRDAQGLGEALIAILVGLWLVWYVGASLGWPRYAFPAVAFGAILVARMLADLIGWLWRGQGWRHWLVYAASAYVVLIVAVPLFLSARAILQPNDSAQRFAAYMDAHVPQDVVVETWEPELGFLTDHRYHYPPITLLDTAVRHEWLAGPPLVYNGLQDNPKYVVVGGFGAYTAIYPPDVLERDYVVEQQIGNYTLFRHR